VWVVPLRGTLSIKTIGVRIHGDQTMGGHDKIKLQDAESTANPVCHTPCAPVPTHPHTCAACPAQCPVQCRHLKCHKATQSATARLPCVLVQR
jgi:hypothetical protein